MPPEFDPAAAAGRHANESVVSQPFPRIAGRQALVMVPQKPSRPQLHQARARMQKQNEAVTSTTTMYKRKMAVKIIENEK